MKLKIVTTTLFIFLCSISIYADSVRISQIDTNRLLINQKVQLYVNVISTDGSPIKNMNIDNFEVYESPNGKKYDKIPKIEDFETYVNYESGINFLLLIDNSGSMYLDMNGRHTRKKNMMRIAYAKEAVINFLRSVTNEKDKVGIVSYNTYYKNFTSPISDKVKVERYLDEIVKPPRHERYTEMYASLFLGVDEFKSIKGRKVIIILTDGVNQPYYRLTGKKHKEFGKKTYHYEEPIKASQQEGVTIFAINFGKRGSRKDKYLNKIAFESGGTVFNAHNKEELKDMYREIVTQILNEYLLTYRATMHPTDKKYVKVIVKKNNKRVAAASRFYFSSTIFGLPMEEFTPLLLLPFLIALLLAWLLSMIKFEKVVSDPTIEILTPGSAKPSTKLHSLSKNSKTVIGGGAKADLTLSGGMVKIKEEHASIVYDDRKNKYTIIGDGNLTVNNKQVKRKDLESGDVISIGDSIIVFDDGNV